MKTANRILSAFALVLLPGSFFLTSSCTTVGDMEYGGAVGWWADGLKLYEEPTRVPDPAIQIHPQSKGLMAFKLHTNVDDGKKKN